MDINQQFEPDRTYAVQAWRSAPIWQLEVVDVAWTETTWLADAEYMAADLVAAMFEVDIRDVKVSVLRGIGPVEYLGSRSPLSWFWAVYNGITDRRHRLAWERDSRT